MIPLAHLTTSAAQRAEPAIHSMLTIRDPLAPRDHSNGARKTYQLMKTATSLRVSSLFDEL
jgi:hypothetical protein